jgi:hypothetical protein
VRSGVPLLRERLLLDPDHGDLALRMGTLDAIVTLVAAGPRVGEVREAGAAIARERSPAPAPASAKSAPCFVASVALEPDVTLVRIGAASRELALELVRAILAPFAQSLGDDPFARKW